MFLGKGAGIVGITRCNAYEPAASRVFDRLGVKLGNHADTDDTKAKRACGGHAVEKGEKGYVVEFFGRRNTKATNAAGYADGVASSFAGAVTNQPLGRGAAAHRYNRHRT